MGRRRGFTLIELFLTLGLIAMVGSVLLIQTKPMIDRYQFNQGVAKLKREIQFSKRLAETAHADIEFVIEETRSGLVCNRRTDEPLNLPRSINTPFKIPHLTLGEKKRLSLEYTGSGAFIGDSSFVVIRGKEKTTISIMP
jgi:hypothetical protein